MYLVQELLRFGNGRNREAVERLHWIHSLMQPAPGFVGAQVCAYLGNSSRHLILRMWENKDAFLAFRATPDGSGYSRSRPEGIYEAEPCGREWELAAETLGPAAGNWLMRGEFDIADGRWDDYLKLRGMQDQMHLASGGLVVSRQFKQIDADNAALMLIRKTGREDHLMYMENENRPGANDDRPRGTFTARGNQYYEIIDETLP